MGADLIRILFPVANGFTIRETVSNGSNHKALVIFGFYLAVVDYVCVCIGWVVVCLCDYKRILWTELDLDRDKGRFLGEPRSCRSLNVTTYLDIMCSC